MVGCRDGNPRSERRATATLVEIGPFLEVDDGAGATDPHRQWLMRNVRSNDRSCHGLLLRKEKLDSGCFSCASLRIPTVDQPQNPPHPRSPGRQWPNGSYRLRPHPPTFWTLPAC